jgi:hypothetical protein
MAVADYRGRLAAFIGRSPGSFTGLKAREPVIINIDKIQY